MATANSHTPNRCLIGGVVVLSFILLEVAIGGQAIESLVRQAVQAQASMMSSHALS